MGFRIDLQMMQDGIKELEKEAAKESEEVKTKISTKIEELKEKRDM